MLGDAVCVTVQWDDGDEAFGAKIVLFGLQAVRFKLEDKPLPLAERLGKTKLKGLFAGPKSAKVGVDENTSVFPLGAFALTMGADYHTTTSSNEKRPNGASFATSLADVKECMLVAGAVKGHDGAVRTLPRILDLLVKLHPTTGSMVEMTICLGNAFKCVKGEVMTKDLVILGAPIAMMTEGGYGAKALELTSTKLLSSTQRRFSANDFKDPLVTTKLLRMDATNMRLRQIESLEELESVVGAKLIEQLKTLLLNWHLLDAMREAAVVAERETLLADFLALAKPATASSPTLPPKGEALLVQGAKSMALLLAHENTRAARTETAASAAARETRFFEAMDDLVELLLENHGLFGCSKPNAAGQKAIEEKLRSLKPLLPTRTDKRLQDEAHGLQGGGGPRNAREKSERQKQADAARKKREAEHGVGISPAGKVGPKDRAKGSGADPSSADVRGRGGDIHAAFSADGDLTTLAAHALQSAESRSLRREKEEVEAKLEKVRKELADEKAAHAVTQAELRGLSGSTSVGGGGQSVLSQLTTALTEGARLKEKVKQQRKRIDNLEFQANHNQAMFLSKLEMDAAKIKAFMPEPRHEDSDDDEQ